MTEQSETCVRHRTEELPCVRCALALARELLAGVTQDAANLTAINEFLLPGSINKLPPLIAPGEMNIVMLRLGPKLFEFDSFDHWVTCARHYYARSGHTGETSIAIDQLGRICDCGAGFRRAHDSDAYPVNVYASSLTVT